jgi:hypothetical protein
MRCLGDAAPAGIAQEIGIVCYNDASLTAKELEMSRIVGTT